jgi:hypothetical protein
VIDYKYDNGANDSDYQAVQIEASNATRANSGKDETANQRPDNSENDIEKEALALFVHDLAGDEPCNQPQYNPCYDRHDAPFAGMISK